MGAERLNETTVSPAGQLQPLVSDHFYRLLDVWRPADAPADKLAPRKWSRRKALLFIIFASAALWGLIAMALYMLVKLV
ncbi:MAG TPA: hypothetical protein VHC39_15115 [Rhizomicrobium sp.]|nr:hypothetical protein [Rhizomicrobium sp.]